MKRQDIWNRLGKRKSIIPPQRFRPRPFNPYNLSFPIGKRIGRVRNPLGLSSLTSGLPVGSLSSTKNISVFVDYAPTSKGKCFKCRIRIIKGTPRGWFNDKMQLKGGKVPKNSNWTSGNTMSVKRLLCFKCVTAQLNMIRDSYKRQVENYTKNIKRIKRMGKMKKASRALDTQRLINALGEAPVSD